MVKEWVEIFWYIFLRGTSGSKRPYKPQIIISLFLIWWIFSFISFKYPPPHPIILTVILYKIIPENKTSVSFINSQKGWCTKREFLKLFYDDYCFYTIFSFEINNSTYCLKYLNNFLVVYFLFIPRITECKNIFLCILKIHLNWNMKWPMIQKNQNCGCYFYITSTKIPTHEIVLFIYF